MKHYVETTPRGWRTGHLPYSALAQPHAHCRNCGAPLWFGQVTFKGKAPAWIPYSEGGHGGGGYAVMEKHACGKHRPAA